MGDRIHASHILVSSKGEAKTLLDLIQRARKPGKEFAKRAKRNSTCPSGRRGGDLGWFVSGQMVAEFDAACREQSLGEVGDPVNTEFGWHLILVHERDF